MKEIELIIKVVSKVINDDTPFQKALNEVLNDKENVAIKDTAKPIVSSLTGSILRHYLLLETISKYSIPSDVAIPFEDKILIYIVLSNFYFVKKLDVDKVFEYYKSKKIPLDLVDITTKYASIYDLLDILIPNKTSNEYYSARYNTPVWLINMWFKHFKRTTTFKILRENVRSKPQTVRLNTIDTTKERLEILAPNAFKETSYENLFVYTKGGNVKSTNFARTFNVIPEERAIKDIVNRVLKLVSPHELFIYTQKDDSLAIDMMLTLSKSVGIYLGVDKKEIRPDLARFLHKYKHGNVSYFETPSDSLEAYVTSKQSLVIVEPRSSAFNDIRTYPDHLIHFKQDNLDSLIANEKKLLEDVSHKVDDGGYLIFIVDTLNKKESASVVTSFLMNHYDFDLVDEKYYFPFEKDGGSFYCGILKKKDNDEEE